MTTSVIVLASQFQEFQQSYSSLESLMSMSVDNVDSNLCDNIASCDNLVSASNELDDIDEEENYMSLEEQRSDSNKVHRCIKYLVCF